MSLRNRAKCNGRPPAPAYQPDGEISMSEKEEKLLEQIRETLNYHQVIWFDGERFQLSGTKQELYQWLYCMRKWLNMARQERIDNEVSPQTVKNKIE